MLKKQWPAKYGIDAPIIPGLARQLLQPLAHDKRTTVGGIRVTNDDLGLTEL
jgi:hypothetical protein